MSEIPTTRVLFVDDEPFVLDAVRRVFEAEEFQLLFATDAKQALRTMEDSAVQVIVSDFRMPGMNGAELLRTVAQNWPDTVRVILSGFADISSVVAAINDGQIYKFVAKPWRNEELKDIIRSGAEKYWQQIQMHALAEATLAQNDLLMERHLDGIQRLTERHIALERHAESLEAYRLAFQVVETPLLLFRNASCFDMNDAARTFLGSDPSDKFGPYQHPLIQALARHVEDQNGENQSGTTAITVELDDGRSVPVELFREQDLQRRALSVARLGRRHP